MTVWKVLPASLISLCLFSTQTFAENISVKSVLIKLIEKVEVPARERGVLTSVSVREGRDVTLGQVMAEIAGKEARLAETRARLELSIATRQSKDDIEIRYARKAKQVAQSELKRANESLKKFRNSISQTEMDRLRLAVERHTLEIEQAEMTLEIARDTKKLKKLELDFAIENVKRREIAAPISGVVVEVFRRRGEWVEPGETVVRILRMDKLRAEGFVNVNDLRTKIKGHAVTLTVDLPGRPQSIFHGTLVFVSPEIDPVNGQVRVWAEIENKELKLRPGLRARMSVDSSPPKTVRRKSTGKDQ